MTTPAEADRVRIGLVCPYSLDVAGGVQFHVRDLAESLLSRGHEVSVLAPAGEGIALPEYVVSAGRAVPIPFNGSVARLAVGPLTAPRVSRWLQDGAFDLVHIHEPLAPSLSALALWAATSPVIATFHTSLEHSRMLAAAAPLARTGLDRIDARIAVSAEARRTVCAYFGGDAVVIPNGVFVDRYACAEPLPAWQGRPDAPTVAFLGRVDEPRKGLSVLLDAWPAVRDRLPGARLLIAGHSDADSRRDRLDRVDRLDGRAAAGVHFLGQISEELKARLLASVDAFVAPHTGGESFGIVLVEAMSAGAPVVASDLPAFLDVLDGGRAGAPFRAGDPAALAETLTAVLADDDLRRELSARGRGVAAHYDWSRVAAEILAVYETVLDGARAVRLRRSRLRDALRGSKRRAARLA